MGGEDGNECALHWPGSMMGWQLENVTVQQPGPLAINSPRGLTGSCHVQKGVSASCVAAPGTLTLASITLTLPYSQASEVDKLLSLLALENSLS